ncbi:MAG: quinolinate synthase NadA [Verrucomicrobia bacterium]|nr:quinolinate synthase NadA [Verrucomicrobiota bacterium]MDA1087272.1 quinolinate synthase NadA [Verrucomicrobiota bacterium]
MLTADPITASQLHEKLKDVKLGGTTCLYPLEKCERYVPLINRINELKAEQNAVVLAHSYVSPEIIYGVADFVGDSYGLAKDAMSTDATTIVFAAVKFMGDTAKILNPTKEVLIPSELNGCTLADSITGDDVRKLRRENPDFMFICYINTSADVKAECDVCVTSSNAYDIVERVPSDKIYFLPDKLMGFNIIEEMKTRKVDKEIKLWDGTCYVHEEYDPDMIDYLRSQHPELRVLSHPECSPGVLQHSDYVGSTSQLLNYMKDTDAETILMLTECGITSRLQVEMPHLKFVGSCSMCRYMKSNTLQDILRVLENPRPQDVISIDEGVQARALACIEAMFEYAERK